VIKPRQVYYKCQILLFSEGFASLAPIFMVLGSLCTCIHPDALRDAPSVPDTAYSPTPTATTTTLVFQHSRAPTSSTLLSWPSLLAALPCAPPPMYGGPQSHNGHPHTPCGQPHFPLGPPASNALRVGRGGRGGRRPTIDPVVIGRVINEATGFNKASLNRSMKMARD
jgi:hypothetical protein